MKFLFIATGILFFAFGVFMPTAWHEALPWPDDAAEPVISGLTLFRVCLGIDGLLLVGLALGNMRFKRIDPSNRFRISQLSPADSSATAPAWTLPVLILITGLALALRVYKIGADLWVDEILAMRDYVPKTPVELFTLVTNMNNHLLNTFLIKASIGIFGESEWAIRLPVMLFGVATIPAVYWISRFALTHAQSLGVALLLTVSYHHIFFSQNARGYIPYVLFSLLATGYLLRALETDAPNYWLFFIAATFLNFSSLLNSGFVFLAHALVAVAALVAVGRGAGRQALPLFRRLVSVFGLAGYLGFHLYCLILPNVLVLVGSIYEVKTETYSVHFLGRITMLIEGVAAGFGGAALVLIPGAVFMLLGLIYFARRNWLLASGLLLPNVVMAGAIGALQLRWQPRFFIFAIPFAFILIVAGSVASTDLIARVWARFSAGRQRGNSEQTKTGDGAGRGATNTSELRWRGVAFCLVGVVALASLWPLQRYYTYPKQDFRRPMERLDELRAPGIPIIAADLAALGLRYYGDAYGWVEGVDYVQVRSAEELALTVSSHPDSEFLMLSTLHENIKTKYPDLWEAMAEDWEIIERFSGTVGNGDMRIWAAR